MLCVSCVGQALGVSDVGPEVVALVSHATQECLRGLLEKVTMMAVHRKAALKVQQSDPDPKQWQWKRLCQNSYIFHIATGQKGHFLLFKGSFSCYHDIFCH